MNKYHASNRGKWNATAERWQHSHTPEEYAEVYQRPAADLHPQLLQYLRPMEKHKALVLSSGDNLSAVALAGLGFQVWSTDISEKQLVQPGRSGSLFYM